MTAEIKGKNLVITIALQTPAVSKGKAGNLLVATSHGNQATNVTINNKPVIVGLNAYIKPDDQ